MNTSTFKKARWFWPWQDDQQETWLEKMSGEGKHLAAVSLPCIFHFKVGEPRRYTYRLDFIYATGKKQAEYLQLFQDAGWEYLGELSDWRYWRKPVEAGETAEIFTDLQSKYDKHRRMLAMMAFFLIFLVYIGSRFILMRVWTEPDLPRWVATFYSLAAVLYAILIPIYIIVVLQVWRRMRQLKKKML